MRMLLKVKFPHEKFNQAVRDGSVGHKVRRILEDLKLRLFILPNITDNGEPS